VYTYKYVCVIVDFPNLYEIRIRCIYLHSLRPGTDAVAVAVAQMLRLPVA